MLRTLIIVVSIGLATGCGAGGRSALFSANNTRVPPPGTKSYGTADNSYYNSNAPRGLSNNTLPTNGVSNAGFVAANSENSMGDLNWRAPNTRVAAPILPDLGSMPPPPEMSSRVAPASFSAPIVPPTTPAMMSNESPIRVLDSSSGQVASSAPQLRPTPVSNAMPMSPPGQIRMNVDPTEITNLPKVTSVPRIRMANSNTPTGNYSPGNAIPANSIPMNAMPIPTFTSPSPGNSSLPAASTAPTLNWRTKS